MYFKSIDINNYGCIEHLSYYFRFNSQGNPIPLVLIGENGSGKTLVLSCLTDSLIEFKRKAFGNNLYEVNDKFFYKVVSNHYIKNNTNTYRVLIKADYSGEDLVYTEISSLNPKSINDDTFVLPGEIEDKEFFEEAGYNKNIHGTMKKKDYSQFINLCFPFDRFYIPLWQNKLNYNRIDYNTTNIVGKPHTNMIKVDILSNIKEWLTCVYLQSFFQLFNLEDIKGITDELKTQLSGKNLTIQIDSQIQQHIKYMFDKILGCNDFHSKPTDRKSKFISFSSQSLFCKDIDQLSEGQMSLFAIALSILKEWDVDHNNFTFEDIKGIVIIDEADLGLHIDYAHDAFPRMLSLFPNVQFIITTHSPFMISGLLDHYGDDIDIVSMPDGTRITDVEVFEEMQKARRLFNAGIEKQKSEIKRLQSEITKLHDLNNQVIIFTEGDTDKILLEKALSKLNITDLQILITPASTGNGNKSDSAIKSLLENIQNNPCASNNIIIGMFDRDSNTKLKNTRNESTELNKVEYIKMGKTIYAFSIPVPHNRPEEDQISIEHYFTDEEIKTPNEQGQRLFFGNEFLANGNCVNVDEDYNYINARKTINSIKIIEHEQNSYVTNMRGEGDYSLSKRRFAEAIRDDHEGFNNFDFSEFNKIFEIIRKIIIDSKSNHTD
ncbi:AAA family ATPase [uncultured Ruminococcus sp.]|uniref:AAA family ATPase n=1 Tax=uncultured Ruminococcus sp. TaxID=165186 RepID=UPI0025D11C83|nr:AAA family ATPase [uncultured Ruminococcus sp.]